MFYRIPMKLACFIFLICTAFSTENGNKKRNFRGNNIESLKLSMNESRLEWQNSSKMKNKLANVFPNETAVKVFRNMETNKISWNDGKNLVPIEKKEEIEIWLQEKVKRKPLNQKGEEISWKQKAEEMSNYLFDRVCKWYPHEEALPFFKELMFVISENVTVKRRGKNNPLTIAARIDAHEAIVRLIERGANVKAIYSNGWTALHTAAIYGAVRACTILLQNGANFNAQDKWGNTPLMLAAQNCKFEVVKLLLATGADPKITNENGNTAVKLATLFNHQNCVKIIEAQTEMPAKIAN